MSEHPGPPADPRYTYQTNPYQQGPYTGGGYVPTAPPAFDGYGFNQTAADANSGSASPSSSSVCWAS